MIPFKPEHWMPASPIDTFFFDCDGTLSLIEGIDILASMNGVGEEVHSITKRCMGMTGLSPEDYRNRLEYVQPNRLQLQQLANMYRIQRTPGTLETIQLLKSLGKTIYIISAGIKSAILPLAQDFGIPTENVLAVDIYLDEYGHYAGFDETSDLVRAEGKNRQILNALKNNENSLLVGDGFSDWEAKTVVTRFVGFSGLNPKQWVQTHSDFFISDTSMYPIINLGLTYEEQKKLPQQFVSYYEKGLSAIHNGLVFIKE
jgi:phosphoserine phosphatase